MIILGIETSCDETAAALVNDQREILAERLISQTEDHRPHGGIVPEIAARRHLTHLPALIEDVMTQAALRYNDLAGVAATTGPGLIGGLIVGANMGKAIAAAAAKPFLAINHLEGHALTARLTHGLGFPYLLLLVSGGHCQLLLVEAIGRYRRLGTTLDDAAGEAFDKAAKLLDLPYPGGPALERLAETAKIHALSKADQVLLPRPMLGRPSCDFSFSGLKTALRQLIEQRKKSGQYSEAIRAHLASECQNAITDCLVDRTGRALAAAPEIAKAPLTALVAAGGVAANRTVRRQLERLADASGLPFIAPPLQLCTDNAAMIAWAGLEHLQLGRSDPLNTPPRPRWPLDPMAPKAIGAGVKA